MTPSPRVGRDSLKITTDTNLLVRLFVEHNAAQTAVARSLVNEAEIVAIPTLALCELVWVLRGVYGQSRQVVLDSVEKLTRIGNVVLDAPVVEAGLTIMRAGGDFADGVIAMEGRALGAETFASFDRKAVRLIEQAGQAARLLA